jgi:hypothetical protein
MYARVVARLRNVRTGVEVPLAARTVVGRSAGCTIRLDSRFVSGEHASITWTGERWQLRDLASRNGTFAGDDRLPSGGEVPLAAGDRIAFGDAEETWVLDDAIPPGLFAVELSTGAIVHSDTDLLALPDERSPAGVVYVSTDGFVAESPEGELRPVADATVLHSASGAWQVRLPDWYVSTAPAGGPGIDEVELRMAVSSDEEHVAIRILHRRGEIALDPREYHYLLLTLARARLEDAALPESERGWRDRDELARMLGMEVNALNVAIFRARQQLAAAGVYAAARVVEVRPGQRRIGVARLHIEGLE